MQDQNRTSRVLIGESFVGEGAEAAHINTVLGGRDGPVGTAWATALAMPRPGHAAFVTILRPNLPVKPLTLFVNKAAMADERHGDLTWGAAQAGVAGGVADAVADGVISAEEAEDLLLIAAIWVNPADWKTAPPARRSWTRSWPPGTSRPTRSSPQDYPERTGFPASVPCVDFLP